MSPLNRRQFLGAAAGAAGLAALGAGCSDDPTTAAGDDPPGGHRTGTTAAAKTYPLPDPASAPFDTVVVLMMENRSFDHFLGWLPGADGWQAGHRYPDTNGGLQATWRIGDDPQGCAYGDPPHDWQAMATHYNDGACDGFLKTAPVGNHFPIGYYTDEDLPVIAALARGYTVFDRYFASMMGPTWPNRLYQLAATTDVLATGSFVQGSGERPVGLQTTIFDRAREAGLSVGYYAWDEPMTELFQSRRYDDITHTEDEFLSDAAAGTLPNVCFVDPDWDFAVLVDDTTNSLHPNGSVAVGQEFIAQVHDALTASPQWERLVAFINFDESGGFYDHVAPPTVQDDTVLHGDGPHPDLKRLGFRVPCIAISPFAPAQVASAGPYEHCSILRLIEWRWGLEPMTLRDRTANNIAESLDFTARRDPVTLPALRAAPAVDCAKEKQG